MVTLRKGAVRVLTVAVSLALATMISALGCGRSDLADELLLDEDAGMAPVRDSGQGQGTMPDTGPTCDASTCPNGCCSNGLCQAGTSNASCGRGGEQCSDCNSLGFAFCSSIQVCATDVGACSFSDCTGCCTGTTCYQGTGLFACGANGVQCQSCTGAGQSCTGQGCTGAVRPTCGPQNCAGCCQNDVCVGGQSNGECGAKGAQCGACDSASQCTGNVCVPKCSPTNCAGCCDQNGACQAGFLDAQCGQSGQACVDCTTEGAGSTCAVDETPRSCTGPQPACPAPYMGCPANLTANVAPMAVCPPSDVLNAAMACTNGAHSDGCNAFMQFEQTALPPCAACLGQFDFDFTELRGIYACTVPFLSTSCNHAVACALDCSTQSCSSCAASQTSACDTNVSVGQCAPYTMGAACESQLLQSTNFCNPILYGGSFELWLQAVGTRYCAL